MRTGPSVTYRYGLKSSLRCRSTATIAVPGVKCEHSILATARERGRPVSTNFDAPYRNPTSFIPAIVAAWPASIITCAVAMAGIEPP